MREYAPAFNSGKPLIKWPGSPREPLPPFPSITATQPAPPQSQCWAHADYVSELPFTPPDKPDIYYHRGNFIGVRVPGFTSGDNDKDRSLVVNWLQPTWPIDQQKLVLKYFIENCSYTHWDLSVPQAWNNNVDINTFVNAAKLANQYLPFITVQCFGGGPETWADIQPWIDALLRAGVRPILCVCWQADKWYEPFPLFNITLQVSAYCKANGLLMSIHWVRDACAWWNAADDPRTPNTCDTYGVCDRFSYQKYMTNIIDFHYMQVDPFKAPVDEIQSGEVKVLESLTTQRLVMAEYDAQPEYNDPHTYLEIYGDQKGFILQCASYNGMMISGYYNGARRRNGTYL